MLINPNLGVVTNSGNSASANRIQKSVQQLSSGDRITRAADDVAGLAIAGQLQNQVSELRSALNNTSQLSSLAQTANGGATQIQELYSRLQELATQANSGALNDDNRAALDQEFQSVVAEIDRIADTTAFNDITLLDGSLTGENALDINSALGEESNGEGTLSVESLRASDLLGELSIATQEGASEAISQIQQALNSVGTTIASIGAFDQQLDFTSAFVETAIANQDAARATISDADFAEAATELSQASLLDNLQITLKSQTNRLPPSLVELIQQS